MGSDRVRALTGMLLCITAGGLFVAAQDSARMWVGGAVALLIGVALTWPLATRRQSILHPVEALPPPDAKRVAVLEAQLEHIPVAAWVLIGERSLQPLSSRARRLLAPGGVRDPEDLHRLLRDSDRSGPVLLETERGSERWQLQRQPLALDGQQQTLLVLMAVENELEFESLRAWRQLLQVLTHEIMNSLTPIKSLSETAQGLLDEPDATNDLRTALDAIARRAEGLSSFVRSYRKVSQWPAPTLAPVDLQALFNRLQQAMRSGWVNRGGDVSFELASPTLRLLADEGQLEQALLALIQNAEQATAEESNPRLWVLARQSRGGRLQISVRDNGPGVPAGLERQIFLPFFSTRESGHGIGLTVVRQLISGMGGRVRHVKPIERGAAFVLLF